MARAARTREGAGGRGQQGPARGQGAGGRGLGKRAVSGPAHASALTTPCGLVQCRTRWTSCRGSHSTSQGPTAPTSCPSPRPCSRTSRRGARRARPGGEGRREGTPHSADPRVRLLRANPLVHGLGRVQPPGLHGRTLPGQGARQAGGVSVPCAPIPHGKLQERLSLLRQQPAPRPGEQRSLPELAVSGGSRAWVRGAECTGQPGG